MNRKVQAASRRGRKRNGTTRSTEFSQGSEDSEPIKDKRGRQKTHRVKRSPAKDVDLTEEDSSVGYVEVEEIVMKKDEKENKRKSKRDVPMPSDGGLRTKPNEDMLKDNGDGQIDKIIKINKQIEVGKDKSSELFNLKVVMDQIQLILESMSKDELLKLCKLKIEEEITIITNKLEKDKKILNLEMSLNACIKEMNFLKKKNKELKSAISTIYEEYKKEKKNSITEVDLNKTPETECTNFPVIISSVASTGSSHNFILPDNPPEELYEFIICDQIKTEDSDGQEAEYITGDPPQIDSFPANVKQETLAPVNLQSAPNSQQQASMDCILIPSESDDCSALCIPTSPSVVLNEKPEECLDIEDKIPHALITCNKSPLRSDSVNPPTKKKTVPGSTHGNAHVEVFNVLQSIDLTNELQKSKTNNVDVNSETENLLNNCTPRIVMTQSLAPKSVAVSNSIFSGEPQQSKFRSSKAKASVVPPNLVPVLPTSTHATTNPTTSESQSGLPQNVQPIMTGTKPMQLAFVMSNRGPRQVYFAISPQNKATMSPQITDVTSLSTAGMQKSPAKCAETSSPSATLTSTATNSNPYIFMPKLLAINTNAIVTNKPKLAVKPKMTNKMSNIIRKRPAEAVLDLTDDEPYHKIPTTEADRSEMHDANGQATPGTAKAINKKMSTNPKKVILSKTDIKNIQTYSKVASLGKKIGQLSNPVLISPLVNHSPYKLGPQKVLKSIVKVTNGQTSIIGYKEEKVKNLELQK